MKTRLKLLLRVVAALCGTKTGRAVVGLYAAFCAGMWLVSQGYILPDGTVDLRWWVNGKIIDFPKINAWWWGGGGTALLACVGLYGRAVAEGPLGGVIKAAVPEVAAVVQALVEAVPEHSEEERPEPVVLHPVAAGLGAGVISNIAQASTASGQQGETR